MDFIPVNVPLLNGNEKQYVMECLDTGWISSEGDFVRRFEEELAQRVGRKYSVAVSNGTVALELAIESLQLEKGSEVIMPTFTIISCALAVIRSGLIPVLIDSDINTWNMDVEQIEKKLTSKTKAIMCVHIYGLPVDMNPVFKIAEKYGLKIIEDAAQMHGQMYYDKPCGSMGEVSTFSFYPNKLITTGEGGMILTDDEGIFERCKSWRNLAHSKEKRFLHHELGYNYRITNLQAALGLAQLEKLDEHMTMKRKMGAIYTELLRDTCEIQIPLTETIYSKNIYWVFGILLNKKASDDAIRVMELLKEKNVDTRTFFHPMHLQPALLKEGLFKDEKYPVAEYLAEKGFYLPSGLGTIEEEKLLYIVNSLKEVLRIF